MIKIAGIDPGLAATGVGIARGTGLKVESYSFGTITTRSTSPLPVRLEKIYTGLLDILRVTESNWFLENFSIWHIISLLIITPFFHFLGNIIHPKSKRNSK